MNRKTSQNKLILAFLKSVLVSGIDSLCLYDNSQKAHRCLAVLMSVVFATVCSIPISAQPKTSTLSQSPTTATPNPSEAQPPRQAFGGQLAVFLGHEELVTRAKFSPDGRQILTASSDKTARLWDSQGNILAVFRGDEDDVNSAEFSPDGRQILTVSRDHSARLWDTSGNLLAKFPRNSISVTTCGVFNPNRSLVISRYITYLWDTSTNTLRQFAEGRFGNGIFEGNDSAVLSPDRQQILTAKDHTVRLCDTSGNLLAEFRGHENAISSAVFSPDGRQILTASSDKTARLWDIQGNLLAVFRGHQDGVNSAAFSPDGRYILTASKDRTARLWDSSGNLLVELRGHENAISSAVFSPDGRQILTVSRDKTARLWDTQGNLLAIFQGGENWEINSAEFSPDGRQILTSSSDHARLWDISAAIAAQTEQAILLQTFEQVLPERNAQIVEFQGHKEPLRSAILSPNGRYILTLTTRPGKTARLWDTQGNLLTVFQGHEDRILSAEFSPDSRHIVTASDKTARLWDTQGKLLTIVRGHSINSAKLSPDGRYILIASDNGVYLGDIQSNIVTRLREHQYSISSAEFSPDGRYILTGNRHGIVRLSDTSGNLLVEFRAHQDWVNSVVFSPNGRYILTASWGTFRLWDTSGNLLKVFREPEAGAFVSISPVFAVFSPDGRYILTTSSGTARLWDFQGNSLAVFDRIYRAVFSPDSRYILTVGKDHTAHLWDVSALIATQAEQMAALQAFQQQRSKNNTQLVEFRGHDGDVNSAAFSPDGRYILTASKDRTARLWDSSGNLRTVFRGHDDWVGIAKFSPDGRYILTARYILTDHDQNTVRLWDTSGNLLKFQEHEKDIRMAEFSSNGSYILTLTVGDWKTARLWNTSGNLLKVFRHEKIVASAVFSPDARRILTASDDGTVYMWDTSGNLLVEFRGHDSGVNSAVFSPDGRQILTASSDKTARLWDIQGNLLAVFRGHQDGVNSAAFSPDGRYILTASKDRTARLWDSSGDFLIEFQRNNSAVFSPDGKYILTTGDYNRLWDISGNLFAEFRGHEHRVNSAVFSPDGKHILTASDDDTARMWDVSAAIYAYAPERLLREGSQLNQQGIIESKQQALQKLEEALKLYLAEHNFAKATQTLLLMGSIHTNLGQFQAALDAYNQALPLSRQAGAKAEEAAILNSLCQLYNDLADPKTALEYYKQALPLLYKLNDKGGAATTLSNIGTIQAATKEWGNALDSYNKALFISRYAGSLAAEATALTGIGSSYIASKEWSTALNAYNQALIISRHLKDKIKETIILNQMGKINAALGQNSTALEHYNQALSLSQQLGYKTEEAHILYNQATLNRQQNNLTAAKTQIETAINIIESLRTQIASQELRQSYFAHNQDYYQFYIDLLMQLHQQNPNQGYDGQALHISERARARSLLELLTEATANIRTGVDPKLLEQERNLQQQLNALENRKYQLQSGQYSEPEVNEIKQKSENILTQLKQLEGQIRATNPRYADLKYPQPLNLQQIQQQVLDDDTLLLQYSLGEDRSFLWAVTKNSITSYVLPKQSKIEAAVKTFRESVTKDSAATIDTGLPLSKILLAPVANLLGNKRLLIVGDGALQFVPFAALPLPNSPTNPLLVQNEIVTLPSASTVAIQRRQLQNRSPVAKTVAVIADPVFSPKDSRITGNTPAQNSDSLSNRSLNRAARNLGLGEDGGGKIFDRLKFTRTEADKILAFVPQAQRLQAFDFNASRQIATNPDLAQYQIIHFATHGLLDPVNPELSGIVLSLYDQNGKSQDGFLRLHDIFNLNLPAELVVLSACETGLGENVKGEGLVGLTRGFIYAGSRRVVVSLWSVNDAATSELMSKFYQKMLQGGQNPIKALREAQLEMWNSQDRRYPYYWAAFTVQGDWR